MADVRNDILQDILKLKVVLLEKITATSDVLSRDISDTEMRLSDQIKTGFAQTSNELNQLTKKVDDTMVEQQNLAKQEDVADILNQIKILRAEMQIEQGKTNADLREILDILKKSKK